LTVEEGNTVTTTVTVNPVNGFNQSVSLMLSGLPTGVTASFSPNPAISNSTLTLDATNSASNGFSTLTVTGTSGTLTYTTTFDLQVAQ
jgi:hypothetical protein